MTTLYRPVLIESAEQAEALPIGTVATHSSGAGMDHAHKPGPPPGHVESLLWISLCGLVSNPGMVGFTALVPIEAEETRSEGTGWIVPTAFGPKLLGAYLGSPDGTPAKRYTQTTWRTPWTPTEEA